MVDKFIEVLNAKAKTYQIDKILEHRARNAAAQAQRVVADTNEAEDECLDKELQNEAQPEADNPAVSTRSRAGSGQRTVTQEVLFTVMDISGVGYELTPKKHRLKEISQAILQRDCRHKN